MISSSIRGINDYRAMAVRYSRFGDADFENLRKLALPRARRRSLRHQQRGPIPVDPFDALVTWFEKGTLPQTLLASGGSAAPPTGRTTQPARLADVPS